MSGSIETIPTQPLVRSPKCTLPSRPPVMPPARPMYWAKMRAGSTPRTTWAARSRCRMQRRSCGGHRPGRAGRHGLLAEAVVEGAGHLALAVERHRALLDAAHHQHRAQQPDAVVRASGAPIRRRGHRLPPAWKPSRSPSGVYTLSCRGCAGAHRIPDGAFYACADAAGALDPAALAPARRLAVARLRRLHGRGGGAAQRCCRCGAAARTVCCRAS